MYRAREIAQYFLSKDPRRKMFVRDPEMGHDCGDGNYRLNEYLHLAQNIYIAKTGGKLFSDEMYAFDAGVVVPDILQSYNTLWDDKAVPTFPRDVQKFLDGFFFLLRSASLEDLMEISHEDEAWSHGRFCLHAHERRMDSSIYADKYRQQYADVLKLIDRPPRWYRMVPDWFWVFMNRTKRGAVVEEYNRTIQVQSELDCMIELMLTGYLAKNNETAFRCIRELKKRLDITRHLWEVREGMMHPEYLKYLLSAKRYLEKREWNLAANEIEDALIETRSLHGRYTGSKIILDAVVLDNIYSILESAGV